MLRGMANHFHTAAKKKMDDLKETLLFIYYWKVVGIVALKKNERNNLPEVKS